MENLTILYKDNKDFNKKMSTILSLTQKNYLDDGHEILNYDVKNIKGDKNHIYVNYFVGFPQICVEHQKIKVIKINQND